MAHFLLYSSQRIYTRKQRIFFNFTRFSVDPVAHFFVRDSPTSTILYDTLGGRVEKNSTMKRIFTTLIMTVALALSAIAQQSSTSYDNFLSVRAGVNFASLISDDYSTDSQSGFNVAMLYNISLMESVPLYLQSGVGIEMKGARNSGLISTVETTHFKSYAIEIPAVVTFDVAINKNMAIIPEFGVFYSFAFTGSLEGDGQFYRPYKKLDIVTPSGEIEDTRLFHRSDFGLRAGVSLRYMRCLFGFSYDAGLVNYFTKDLRDAGFKSSTGSWSINVGYRFN